MNPDRAPGARAWVEPLDRFELERSLELWYEFHRFVDAAVAGAVERFGRALDFDLHSYNERPDGGAERGGTMAPPSTSAPPTSEPTSGARRSSTGFASGSRGSPWAA